MRATQFKPMHVSEGNQDSLVARIREALHDADGQVMDDGQQDAAETALCPVTGPGDRNAPGPVFCASTQWVEQPDEWEETMDDAGLTPQQRRFDKRFDSVLRLMFWVGVLFLVVLGVQLVKG